jgi:hypothetical protein
MMVLLFCMAQTNAVLTIVAEPVAEETGFASKLESLLVEAAELAAEHDVTTEVFMASAWQALLAANPGLREELADKELRANLKKLRRQGLIGQA